MTLIQKVKDEIKKTLNMVNEDSFEENQPAPELQISELVVGGKVEVINSDGSLSPAPDGTYKVDDNEIEVKDGLIESINGEKETPKETAPVDNSNEDFSKQITELKSEFDAIKSFADEQKTLV